MGVVIPAQPGYPCCMIRGDACGHPVDEWKGSFFTVKRCAVSACVWLKYETIVVLMWVSVYFQEARRSFHASTAAHKHTHTHTRAHTHAHTKHAHTGCGRVW
jgi:hypothetical protein